MRNFHFLIIALLVAASCSHQNVRQGSDSYWQAMPSGDRATVHSIALGESGILLAGTDAGLFISKDQGESWHLRGPVDWHINAVLSTSGGAILIGTYREGVKQSLDGGHTWTTVGFKNNVYVDALIEDDGRVFAAVAYAVNDEPTGIFHSDDDGETWVQTGLEGEQAVSVSAPIPGHLYAGTSNGTFRSVDGGATWRQIDALSFPAPLSQVVVYESTIFASFAESRYRAPGGGVMRSTDGGTTWVPMDGLPAETSVHALAVVGNTIFAASGDIRRPGGMGVYRSVDHQRWEQVALEDQWLRSMATTKEGTLFVGAIEAGVFMSGDSEADWSLKSTGLRNWELAALAFDDSGRLTGISLQSLFTFDEPSNAWILNDLPELTADATPMNFTNLSDGTLLVSGFGGMLFSSDATGPWALSEYPGTNESALGVHVADDDRIFATLWSGETVVTSDAGETWSSVDVPDVRIRGVFVSPAGTLFSFGDGVYRKEIEKGWIQVASDEQRVMTIKACGNALYFGGLQFGVFTSQDDGRTWRPVSEELRQAAQQTGYIGVHTFLCLPNEDLLVATFSDGIFNRAKDGTWKNVNAGLPSRSAGDLALGPDGKIYVVTTSGVYRSLVLVDKVR